jgi:RNA polymerase sigma-70 factor (ECF subfamily)
VPEFQLFLLTFPLHFDKLSRVRRDVAQSQQQKEVAPGLTLRANEPITMNHALLLDTSTSFIQRLGQQDHSTWDQFATKYTWMMRRWMQSWNVPIHDVEDVLQETLLEVLESVHHFDHRGKGSFRAWLKKVSRNCWLQSVRQAIYRNRQTRVRFDLASCLSESTMQTIDTQIDELIEREAFDLAIIRTRSECNDTSWEAYRLMAFERLSGSQVAEMLGVTIDVVYKSKDRFERQLNAQLLALESIG